MHTNFTLPSDLFDRFQMIHEESSYEIIRFYEQHEDLINFMGVEEYFIILCYYNNALFATEDFEKHKVCVEEVLKTSIIENIPYVDGVDVYLHALEQKVQTHLKLGEQDEAIKVAKQLLALAPKNKRYKKLLRKALMSKRPVWVLQAFGAALWFAIAWTALEIVQLMFLEAFFSQVLVFNSFLQAGLVLAAFISFIAGWRTHHKQVEAVIKSVLRKAK